MRAGARGRRRPAGLAPFAVLLLATAPRLAAQDPGPILDRADSAYNAVHSFAADFVQIVTNPMIGAPDTTHGVLLQLRPNGFEMRFSVPKGDRIVADGRYLWLYTPSTTPGQVIRSAIPTTGTTGPNLIGQFVDHARVRYVARYVRADTLAPDSILDVIDLKPKAPDQPYTEAVIWLSQADGLVRRLDITESSGQARTVLLSHVRVNQPLPPDAFRFSVPHRVRVIDQ